MDNTNFNEISETLDGNVDHQTAVVRPLEGTQGLELKRKISLLSGVGLIVGSIIGSGIFITPGGVLERSGSVGLALVLWAFCGLVSILGALAYAELGTLIPKSGGEYAYFFDGLGSLHPFWGPLPAFLYSWLSVLLLSPAGTAAGCMSCATYTISPLLSSFDICLENEDKELLLKLTAILYLGLTTALNCYSVDWTIRVNNFCSLAKVGAVSIVIGCGVYQLCNGKTGYLSEGFQGSTTDFGTIATACYGGFWAYNGWNTLNFITEELKNPDVNLPRAIIFGISLVTACYLAINVAYLTILSPAALIKSDAVAVEIGNHLLGPMAFVIPLAVALSTFGALLTNVFVIGRICFSSAREGHMLDVLSYVHVEHRTPFPALLFTGLITLLLIMFNDLAGLIDFFSFTIWIIYVLAMIVLLILRKTRPNSKRPYKVPLIIPIIVIIVGSYLIVAPIITNPAVEYVYILVVFLVGFVVYVPFVYYKYYLSHLVPITKAVALTLKVAPTKKPTFE